MKICNLIGADMEQSKSFFPRQYLPKVMILASIIFLNVCVIVGVMLAVIPGVPVMLTVGLAIMESAVIYFTYRLGARSPSSIHR